jgi:hypothetical protein
VVLDSKESLFLICLLFSKAIFAIFKQILLLSIVFLEIRNY